MSELNAPPSDAHMARNPTFDLVLQELLKSSGENAQSNSSKEIFSKVLQELSTHQVSKEREKVIRLEERLAAKEEAEAQMRDAHKEYQEQLARTQQQAQDQQNMLLTKLFAQQEKQERLSAQLVEQQRQEIAALRQGTVVQTPARQEQPRVIDNNVNIEKNDNDNALLEELRREELEAQVRQDELAAKLAEQEELLRSVTAAAAEEKKADEPVEEPWQPPILRDESKKKDKLAKLEAEIEEEYSPSMSPRDSGNERISRVSPHDSGSEREKRMTSSFSEIWKVRVTKTTSSLMTTKRGFKKIAEEIYARRSNKVHSKLVFVRQAMEKHQIEFAPVKVICLT